MKISRQLEFRGIRIEHLIDYFKELNGTQITNEFPIMIQGNLWKASIINEAEVKITSTFIVNAVHIDFSAETVELLEELIKCFRKKTTRIGG